jgi:hypothetical protein
MFGLYPNSEIGCLVTKEEMLFSLILIMKDDHQEQERRMKTL